MREIYLAGGCFWGLEKYLGLIRGVKFTEAGYANGDSADTDYASVCSGSGHAEAVKVVYDEAILSLRRLLDIFYKGIDPLSVNRQGNDVGVQYRTGVYYTDLDDGKTVADTLARLSASLGGEVAVEHGPLENWCRAEEVHQDYLSKNPRGYCHIHPLLYEYASNANTPREYDIRTDAELEAMLTPLQYAVIRKGMTERPFTGEYDGHYERGVYVDVATGEPLFLSTDKYDSGSGWPSFTAPATPHSVIEFGDTSHGMVRTEVRSRSGDSHLGHVFEDGPGDRGGKRYCINSAALRFVPLDRMVEEGYGHLLPLIR